MNLTYPNQNNERDLYINLKYRSSLQNVATEVRQCSHTTKNIIQTNISIRTMIEQNKSQNQS